LPVNGVEFVNVHLCFSPYRSIKKPGRAIVVLVVRLFCLTRHDRGQLIGITKHDQLNPTEGGVFATLGLSKPAVHGVEDIGRHHRNLIDHESIEVGQYREGFFRDKTEFASTDDADR